MAAYGQAGERQPVRRAIAMASTASSGFTLASSRSRQVMIASSRWSVAPGVPPAARPPARPAGRAAGRTQLARPVGVDQLDGGAELHREQVAVVGGQVEQGTVECVTLRAGG